jgi:hypothetical protein
LIKSPFGPTEAQFKSFELSTTLWALAKLGSMEDGAMTGMGTG